MIIDKGVSLLDCLILLRQINDQTESMEKRNPQVMSKDVSVWEDLRPPLVQEMTCIKQEGCYLLRSSLEKKPLLWNWRSDLWMNTLTMWD